MGWGSSTQTGGGRKVLALPRKFVLGFEDRNLGCPRHYAGMSRTPGGVQKVCVCAKKFVRIFRSLPKKVGFVTCCFPHLPVVNNFLRF